MRMTEVMLAAAGLLALPLHTAAPAFAQTAAALSGEVSSAKEGAMEGVVVSAKRDGSTITVSVISDDKGHFSFPASRLDPGHYAIGIRAVGYDIDGAEGHDRCGRAGRQDRHQAQANAKSQRADDERRMAHEHAGNGRSEALGARLQ